MIVATAECKELAASVVPSYQRGTQPKFNVENNPNLTVWSNQTVSHGFMHAVSEFYLYFEQALLLLCVIGYFLAHIRHGFTGYLADIL